MTSRHPRLVARLAAAILLALVSALVVAAPSTADVTATTSTTTASVAAGASTSLDGLSVTADAPTEPVSVIVSTDVGTVSVAVAGTGATIDFGYTSSGTHIAFSGTAAQVNAALETISLSVPAAAKGSAATVDILARNTDGTVYSPVTEHFYEYIPAPGISWTAARADAATRTYAGQQGYLATVPNAPVNDLITSKIPGAINVWLGGSALDWHDGYARVWEWVDGPLAGEPFTRCANNGLSQPCVILDTGDFYENWAPSEPNNFNPGEYYVVTNWEASQPGEWNDLPGAHAAIDGYVVEYGDLPIGTSVPYTGLDRDSSTVFIVGPPDPVTNLAATAGVGAASVAWDAPSNDGGSALTEYEVVVSGTGAIVSCDSPTSTECEVSGLTSGTEYTVTVTAINAAGESAPRSVTVTPGSVPSAPAGPLDQVVVGESYSDQVTSSGHPAPTFSVTAGALPSGLVLNASTGVISGSATTTGPWSAAITATNAFGSATTTFTGTVGQGAAITTTTVGPFTYGIAVDVDLTADGSPVPTWSATDVPPGLTLEADGRLHGTPTEVGDHELSVAAGNAHGTDSASYSVSVTPVVAGAPTIDDVIPGDGTLTIEVVAPASSGGSAVTHYEYSIDGGDTWVSAAADGAAGPIVIEDLTNGTEYSVQVRAINAAGASPASAAAPGTPYTVPHAPVLVSAVPGDSTVTLDFEAPDVDGGSAITGYEYTTDGGTTWISTDALPGDNLEITGLDNGTQYTVSMRAVNAAGASTAAGAITTTPLTTPDAPAITSVVDGDGDLTIQFDAPGFDGGDAISAYELSIDGGATWFETSAAPGDEVVLDGLTNGTEYEVTVRAVNSAGAGAPSDVATGTPRTTPDAPVITGVTPGNGTVTVDFTAPASNGGSPLTGYQYTIDGGTTWHAATVEDGSISIDGLANGTEYDVAIRAINEAGPSVSSNGESTTPRTVPGAPVISDVVPGNGTLAVDFAAPSFDGGSTITGFEYTIDGGTTWVTAAVSDGSFTIEGLANGTEYDVTLRASNAAGSGAPSEPASGTPRTVADAPVVTSLTASDGTITVAFDEPVNDGGVPVSGYEYTIDGGTTWVTAIVHDGTIAIEGLANGTEYTVQVRAINASGPSAPSEEQAAQPFTTPGAPVITVAEPGSRSITVEFGAPDFDGGSTITGYEYSLDGGTTWIAAPVGAGEAFVIYGLTNGTDYDLVTRAVNAAGPGTPSEAVTVTPVRGPVTVPGPAQPTLPNVQPGDGTVIIDGQPVESTTQASGDGIAVSGGGVTALVSVYDGQGDLIEVDPATGKVEVHRDGSVLVSGAGFAPGSVVDVWLLSGPTLLGEIAVREDGTFSAMLDLPEGLALGDHTLQLNGLSDAGESISINTGISVVEVPVAPEGGALSNTGADLRPAGAAAALLIAGIGLALLGRRRHLAARLDQA